MNPFRLTTRLAPPREAVPGRAGVHQSGAHSSSAGLRRAPENARAGQRARFPPGSRTDPSIGTDPNIGRTAAMESHVAVQVPWRIERRSASGIEIVNTGDVPLRAARFALAGSGLLGLSLPRTVHPRERLRVVLRGAASDGVRRAPDAILTLRWFQPDGRELLWPIAL